MSVFFFFLTGKQKSGTMYLRGPKNCLELRREALEPLF